MKVFWSWQSDTPGKIGRHFVRQALEEVLAELKAELTIEEPGREDLHLDHDRKGVPGSPDLAPTILEKIRESSIFVADVTPVGKSDSGRARMNPNVAIELGYALAHVGNQGLLMVLNGFFGDRESLPFDLRHKAGPIMFNLAPDASGDERKRVYRELTQILKSAIRECLNGIQGRSQSSTHEEVASTSNRAQYFEAGQVLDERQVAGSVLKLTYWDDPLLYLRVIPTSTVPPLRWVDIKDIVYGINLKPLAQYLPEGSCWGRNSFGGITYSFNPRFEPERILTSSQIFHNREIWGIDASLMDKRNRYIPIMECEEELENGLRHYIEVARDRLNLRCPLIVEAGAARVQGFKMVTDNKAFGDPIYTSEIRSRQTFSSFQGSEVNRLLLAIFEDFFDAVGKRRPQQFRSFPQIDSST